VAVNRDADLARCGQHGLEDGSPDDRDFV